MEEVERQATAARARWPKVLMCLIFLIFLASIIILEFDLHKDINPPDVPQVPAASPTTTTMPIPFEAGKSCTPGTLDLPDTHFCWKGKVVSMASFHGPEGGVTKFYHEVFHSLQKPPLEKRTFAPLGPGMKLEVVLIETKAADSPRLLPTMYNIGWIHGGSNVGFTVIHHAYLEPAVAPIKPEWPNVRWIQINGPFTIQDYNQMLTSIPFFNQFQSQYILLTHTDSIIYRTLDDDFYNYDYVGSPWPMGPMWCGHGHKQVGNGGYCLRKVAAHIALLSRTPYNGGPEDLWWCKHLKNEQLPTEEVANRFGTEITWFDGIPTGSHQLWHMYDPWTRGGRYLSTFIKNCNMTGLV